MCVKLRITLTDGVANTEPILRGPVVVELAVVHRWDDPAIGVPNLKLVGRDAEEMKGRERDK